MKVKNPFSLYDFLGYIIPGALALFIIFSICKVDEQSGTTLPFDYINQFMAFLRDKTKIDLSKVVVPFVIVSYVLGHLFSYLSSVTVEYVTNRTFYYPSQYLLNAEKDDKSYGKRYWEDDSSGYKKTKRLCLIALFILLFPITIMMFLIPNFSEMLNRFISRPLPSYLINNIIKKIKDLTKEINISDIEEKDIESSELHRVVMHYVYLNEQGCRIKADNYIALYGFLRSTSLILILFTDWTFFVGVKSIVVNWGGQVCLASIIMFISLWLVSCVSFLGFVKFYRRFTLENLMTLMTCKWHKA